MRKIIFSKISNAPPLDGGPLLENEGRESRSAKKARLRREALERKRREHAERVIAGAQAFFALGSELGARALSSPAEGPSEEAQRAVAEALTAFRKVHQPSKDLAVQEVDDLMASLAFAVFEPNVANTVRGGMPGALLTFTLLDIAYRGALPAAGARADHVASFPRRFAGAGAVGVKSFKVARAQVLAEMIREEILAQDEGTWLGPFAEPPTRLERMLAPHIGRVRASAIQDLSPPGGRVTISERRTADHAWAPYVHDEKWRTIFELFEHTDGNRLREWSYEERRIEATPETIQKLEAGFTAMPMSAQRDVAEAAIRMSFGALDGIDRTPVALRMLEAGAAKESVSTLLDMSRTNVLRLRRHGAHRRS